MPECASKSETFGLIKTLVDAHTMGVHAAAALLRDCGYRVMISPREIEEAAGTIHLENSQRKLLDWIRENRIVRIGFSYRLDPGDAVDLFGRLVYTLKNNGYFECADAQVKSVFFAGLKPACERIEQLYGGRISTFRGGESAEETLLVMGVPMEDIPKQIKSGCQYDKDLLEFGRKLIEKGEYKKQKPLPRTPYPEFGTDRDRVELRLQHNFRGGFQPLIRAHSGPFSADKTREQCLAQYQGWCRELAAAGFLDILSIGSSQLSQSNFGEKWGDRINGGGVPVNSEAEYHAIWQAARPMLVRTYSGTKNILELAQIYERSINICWHALSLWWFNELDGRGPNRLYDNLKEHIDAIRLIAAMGKPVETNVPHHFAFRGCDDVTYIVSSFLAAKMAKRCGVRTFILQNMLNTPRSTWGIQDLAKSRVMLRLVKELEDESFRVILQTRAGLDYFKPNLEEARCQLAAVTAMMDDIDPDNAYSPEIIHVVSYSEAVQLATPEILNESIQITRQALQDYRQLKRRASTPDVMTEEIRSRTAALELAARKIIAAMETNIPELYSPEGLYLAFVGGWLPVPELWSDSEEFRHAKGWGTQMKNGSVRLMDHELIVTTDARIQKCLNNLADARYILKQEYGSPAKKSP
ncbi:MAG: cobalamin-binding protein [Oscillospiraceae bacterium]|nr:cobalamin-binding protein [Oscillospiraceae bacterium]